MHFGLNDIDPAVAETFRAKVNELWRFAFTDSPERDRAQKALDVVMERQKSGQSVTVKHLTRGLLLGGLMVSSAFVLHVYPLAAFAPPAVAAGYWLSYFVSKGDREYVMNRSLRGEEVEAVTPLLSCPDAERAYLETLGLLAGMGDAVDGTTVRSILGELNRLIAQWRQLEQYRKNLVNAIGSATAAELDTKRADLARRLELMRDPAAKTAAEHSLQLIDERIAGAQALQPNLERVLAQQEAIMEAFASSKASLARMKVAPAPTSAPDLEEIARNINQVAQQARAVEQAVQEVASIRV